MTFTANGKNETLPSLFGCLYSRMKSSIFAKNSGRSYFTFVCFIYKLEEKNSKSKVIFAVCRLPLTSCLTSRITAEIHARSLANFYCQYADRCMNLKFMRRVSERERAIRQFVIVKNKLMSVCNVSVLLLTMNFVITLSK